MPVAENVDARPTQIHHAIKKYWGFESLRPLQREVVDAALDNRDAVVVLPTGGGKSLCFQLPAVVSESLTVVVSPLIALMKDQVDALTVVGVPAAALNSSMSSLESSDIQRQLIDGTLRILYVSPERLLIPSTMNLLSQANRGRGVSRFAIDEAHCISAWGHDFRPEYRQLTRIREVFPEIPIQAFTATATPKVQRDIAIQLNLSRPRKFIGNFDRPNLTYRIVAKDDAVRRTVEAVRRYPNEGVIVYCLSRKDTESIANALIANDIPAVAYHAGLPPDVRKKVSEDFAGERANIIVATVAFGMGIDRANVRCVIHECLPKSMEGFQQETGRAGRDGLPSECVLLYGLSDVVRLKRLVTTEDVELTEHQFRLLEEVRRFAISHQCRHKSLCEHFGQPYDVAEEGCGACDVCLGGMAPLENSTKIAHKIIYTANELLNIGDGRTFGVKYLASVLVGSRVKTVTDRGGQNSKGFGAFAGESLDRVSSWVHQLMDLGFLTVSEGQYPVVGIPAEGRTALANRSEILMMENVALLAPAKTLSGGVLGTTYENIDEALFEKLRTWRRLTASERQVPAYVIFHDATLMRISAYRPSCIANLMTIPGVGEKQLENFGTQIMDEITKHVRETGATTDQPLVATKTIKQAVTVTPKQAVYYSYFTAGHSIEDIASKTGMQQSTIWGHFDKWIEYANPESIDRWVDKVTMEKVRLALEKVGHETLGPVFIELNESVSYSVIRSVRTFLQRKGLISSTRSDQP